MKKPANKNNKENDIMNENKKTGGWPIEDDELDNVSGGDRPVVAGTLLCPNCQNRDIYHGSYEPRECKKCGCHWNSKTGEILN